LKRSGLIFNLVFYMFATPAHSWIEYLTSNQGVEFSSVRHLCSSINFKLNCGAVHATWCELWGA